MLISRANTKEFVGAVVLVDRDYPLRLLSDKTLRLVINENLANKEYLLFALRAPKARKHIEHFATGTSDSMRNISQGVITSIPIDLPPLDEQCRIAARLKIQLEQVGTAWQAAKEQNQEAEALRASIYREAFRKSVPVAVPPNLGESPSQWHWHKLSDVARLESGHTPSRLRPDWWGGDVSWSIADRDPRSRRAMGRGYATAYQRGRRRQFGGACLAARHCVLLAHSLGRFRRHYGPPYGNESGFRKLGMRQCPGPGVSDGCTDPFAR
ncbi:hypothetical protein ACVISU_004951 [Bradyrhizobium sp. USDA 4452]